MTKTIKVSRLINIGLALALLIFLYYPDTVKTSSFTTAYGYTYPGEYLTFGWWAGPWAWIAIGCMAVICLLSCSKFYYLSTIGAAIILFCVILPTITIHSSTVRICDDFIFYANLFFALLLFGNCLYQMLTHSKNKHQQNIEKHAITPADELKKYRDLYECGAITQEEFEAKKKQLLSL